MSKAVSDISEALRQKGFASMRTDPDEERPAGESEAVDNTNLEQLSYVGPMSQVLRRCRTAMLSPPCMEEKQCERNCISGAV